eukprot:CAMPEP_0201480542 /NCGR_PEP_ID=MMETSP0151_2-20130828/5013_1 /ASSEMBLY_ACC=CAM_ASM_000257 /TAXON_ID=200890 /ORGANISM="Paramoeba atlantica, Strain 621/1 / CCAP 1560/9" /LENGTH=676 /DNA_ID=CAMNT_0047862435 /DNA_START=56 /DNA_END=2086 /DNA_ORIENTATION=+
MGDVEALYQTVAAKEKEKYESQRGQEEEIRVWMAEIIPARAETLNDFSISMYTILKDGVVLCELLNGIIAEKGKEAPSDLKGIARIHQPGMAFKERENISKYLGVCKKMGLQDFLFETNDLYDGKGMTYVLNNLAILRRITSKSRNTPLKLQNRSSGQFSHAAPFSSPQSQQKEEASPKPVSPKSQQQKRDASSPRPASPRPASSRPASLKLASPKPTSLKPPPSSSQKGSSPKKGSETAAAGYEEDEEYYDEEEGDYDEYDEEYYDEDGEYYEEEGEEEEEDDDDFIPSDGGFLEQGDDEDDSSAVLQQEGEASKPSSTSSSAFFARQINTAPSVPNIDDDVKTKVSFSYNTDLEKIVKKWIEDVLGGQIFGAKPFAETLKSGVVLCNLVNKVKPGVIPRVHESSIAFKQIENIGNYIKACTILGMSRGDIFDVPDLFNEKNMTQVLEQIHRFARYVKLELKVDFVPKIEQPSTLDLWKSALVESTNDMSMDSGPPPIEMNQEELDLVAWMNSYLLVSSPNEVVNNLVELRSGLAILRLLEALSGGTVGGYVHFPSTLWHFMQNVSQVFRFLASQYFERIDCHEQDVVRGNREALTTLIKYIRKKYDRDYDVKSEVLSSCLAEMGLGVAEIAQQDDEFLQTVLSGLVLDDEEQMLGSLESYLGSLSERKGGEEEG